jgi:hypothetical protein
VKRLPIDHRLHLIGMLAGHFLPFSWGECTWELPPETPDVREAIDALLAQCLDDGALRTGMSGTWGGKSISNPRLGDMAAHLLSRRWGEPSRFDLEAPPEERERQRVVLRDMGRSRKLPD